MGYNVKEKSDIIPNQLTYLKYNISTVKHFYSEHPRDDYMELYAILIINGGKFIGMEKSCSLKRGRFHCIEL